MKSSLSRRALLTRASAGAITIGALSSMPLLASAVSTQAEQPVEELAEEITVAEPLVVYIHNPSAGEIAVLSGTQEVTHHDPELVARLLKLID